MSGLELSGLSKTFPGGIEAVRSVDLAVAPGEFLAIVGPSGSGKSTILRMIAGLETPTAGSIAIGGRDVTRLDPKDRDVAMVFQDPALFPYLSVFDNLAFGLRARGTDRAETRRRVEAVAATLGVSDELARRPGTLSGGQRQRVALGRAVVRQPAVFLFDEPLSRLDAPLRAAIRAELIDLHRRVGATMVFVTHDQQEALALGDRVALMDRGRVVQVGSPREVYERPASRFAARFIGSPPMRLIPGTIEPGDGPVAIRLDGLGESIPLPHHGFLAGRRGQPVELGLRPEAVLLIDPAAPRDPSLCWLGEPTEVVRVEFLGHETIATVRIGSAEVDARRPGPAAIHPGDRPAVGLHLARASWFDPRTGERMSDGR